MGGKLEILYVVTGQTCFSHTCALKSKLEELQGHKVVTVMNYVT